MNETRFCRPPSSLSEEEFISTFGGVYEHSPWIARKLWRQGLGPDQDNVEALAAAMAAIVDEAEQSKRLELIVSHPDLAGKAAQSGELTSESTSEQASAGIDQCNAEEFQRFQDYNESYQRIFGFPFVMAVKGSNRYLILAAFEERLENDYQTEFDRAIQEIHKIARFRLDEIAGQS